MSDLISESLADRRLAVLIIRGFSFIALGLTATGVYGVIAYVVAHRRNEIAIRLALGAQASDIVRLIVREAMRPVAIGIVAGIAGSVAVSHSLASVFFNVSPYNLVSLVEAVGVIGLTGVLACCLPARHAAQINPAAALH